MLHAQETTSHLFFHCKVAYSVWCMCYDWLELKLALPFETVAHCWCGWLLCGVSGICGMTLSLTKYSWTWGKLWTLKFCSWSWLKVKAPGFTTSFYEWCNCPRVCLNNLYFWCVGVGSVWCFSLAYSSG